MISLRPARRCRWKPYGAPAKWEGPKPHGEIPVNDAIYLALGAGVLALMALYALACERL